MLATAAAIGAMSAASFAIWLMLPASAINGGMWFFLFLVTLCYGLYLWQQPGYDQLDARQWAHRSLLFLAGFAVFWIAGIFYAYSHGVRDGSALLFQENGGFLLVFILGLPIVLATGGGAVRAWILKVPELPGLGGMTVNERLAYFRLFPRFDAAVKARDKQEVIAVLLKAGFSAEQAEYTASTVLGSPGRYGY